MNRKKAKATQYLNLQQKKDVVNLNAFSFILRIRTCPVNCLQCNALSANALTILEIRIRGSSHGNVSEQPLLSVRCPLHDAALQRGRPLCPQALPWAAVIAGWGRAVAPGQVGAAWAGFCRAAPAGTQTAGTVIA